MPCLLDLCHHITLPRLFYYGIDANSGAMKLQKEKDRLKKEKKKEKRREKKEKKDKSKDGNLIYEGKKHESKKRRREERHQMGHSAKMREEDTEQLERSSLTEEQGLPSAQYICDSPDSSQNSRKRKKHNTTDVSKNMPGGGLRIRFPLLKHKDPEPPALEQPSLALYKQKKVAASTRAELPFFLLHNQKEAKASVPAEQPSFSGQQPSSLHRHNEARALTPSEQPSFAGQTSFLLQKQNQVRALNPAERPSLPLHKQKEVRASTLAEPPCSSGQPFFPMRIQRDVAAPIPAKLPFLPDQSPLPLYKRQEFATCNPAEEACFSGRTETTLLRQETKTTLGDLNLQQSYNGSSKSRRSEAKLKDLLFNWEPQPLVVEQPEIDDQEWLFGDARNQNADNVKSCQDDRKLPSLGNALSSWPPRACHLPEADVYALPFVLPF